MNNQFTPHQEEKVVTCTITHREALVLQELRKYSYGQFTIHKTNGIIIRTEIKESKIIDESGKVTLSIVEK